MGFYYGSNEPPKEDPPPGSWRETIAIIWAVFKTLALPLGILFGAIFAMVSRQEPGGGSSFGGSFEP